MLFYIENYCVSKTNKREKRREMKNTNPNHKIKYLNIELYIETEESNE